MSEVAPQAPTTDEVGEAEPRAERKSFGFDFAHTSATNIMIAGINAVTGVLVARMLNPAGRGELAAIINWPTVLGMLATLGFSEALVYFSAREPRRAGRYLGTGIVISLGAAAVFTVIGWLLMPWLLSAQSAEVVTAARWYLLQVPVAAVLGLATRPLRGVGDVRAWNYLRTLPTLVWLGVVVGYAVRGSRVEAGTLALTFVIVRVALIPVTLIVVARRLRQPIRAERSLGTPLLRYGVPSVLAALPSTLNLRVDQLLIAGFLPPGDLGIYAVAVSWSLLPLPVLLGFGNVLFPRVAEIGDLATRARLAGRGVRVGTVISLTLTLMTMLLAPVAIPLLFGHRYDVAVPTALVLTVASAFIGINGVQEEAVRGLGHPVAVLWAQLAGLGVTAVGLAITIPTGKLFYIAFASVAGYLTLALVLGVLMMRFTALGLADLLIPRRADLAMIAERASTLTRNATGSLRRRGAGRSADR